MVTANSWTITLSHSYGTVQLSHLFCYRSTLGSALFALTQHINRLTTIVCCYYLLLLLLLLNSVLYLRCILVIKSDMPSLSAAKSFEEVDEVRVCGTKTGEFFGSGWRASKGNYCGLRTINISDFLVFFRQSCSRDYCERVEATEPHNVRLCKAASWWFFWVFFSLNFTFFQCMDRKH